MTETPATRVVELDVRDDAESMFVPEEAIPDAEVGDDLTVVSRQPEAVRAGRVVEMLDDALRGRFARVTLD
jgi:hypothetical protein